MRSCFLTQEPSLALCDDLEGWDGMGAGLKQEEISV